MTNVKILIITIVNRVGGRENVNLLTELEFEKPPSYQKTETLIST